MQAIKLSKKYPEFKQDEVFDLINKFQCVGCNSSSNKLTRGRQIDVDDKGAVDKATVISALQASGDADYDVVRCVGVTACTDGFRLGRH